MCVLHLERRLCRSQRRLRLRSSQWTDTVAGYQPTIQHQRRPGRRHGRLQSAAQHRRVGLEGDIGWSGIKGSTTVNCLSTCETSNGWLGTARGRIGYAFDRFLPYFTGGAAFGEVKGSVLGFGSFSQTKVGWTVGGGLEYAFVDNWTPSSNISMSISARRPAARLLRRQSVRRYLPDQHRARRRQLQILSAPLGAADTGPASAGPSFQNFHVSRNRSTRGPRRPGAVRPAFAKIVMTIRRHPQSYMPAPAGTGETAPFSLRSDGWAAPSRLLRHPSGLHERSV
jgi:hypothetical protein